MNRKNIAKNYVKGEFKCTPITNKLPKGILGQKRIKYLDKMCDIVGWSHAHGISVNISLYKRWAEIGKLIGRKQDYTATIGWGYRTAIWVEKMGEYKYLILYNLRGLSIEVDNKVDSGTVSKIIHHLEETLLP